MLNRWNGNRYLRVYLEHSTGIYARPVIGPWKFSTKTLNLFIHINLMPRTYLVIRVLIWHWEKFHGMPH